MNLITKLPRGTKDILPDEAAKWMHLEKLISQMMELYGFGQIRTPVFEHTELFERGVGDTTDVVQKEMYTFIDKGGRSITLRPEGTAGVVRALLENGLYAQTLPQKLYYFANCYRYEKPQAGRQREFTQFGVEVFGADSPTADAEVISIPYKLFKKLGITGIKLYINSIGCPECRARYQAALKEYFADYKDKLCETCLGRLERNPMRILDCKSPICHEIGLKAPKMLNFLCEDCDTHFEKLKGLLTEMGIEFEIDSSIVRGLDYYTKTVFEYVSTEIGSQGTVCGGGRYDGLCEELSGVKLSGLGFGLGLGRLLLVLEAAGYKFPSPPPPSIYIASIGDRATAKAISLCDKLRDEGIAAWCDLALRSVKAQMKYADKIGAAYVAVLGDDECDKNIATVKNMSDGSSSEISLESFATSFKEIIYG